jgi:hypothetical protein
VSAEVEEHAGPIFFAFLDGRVAEQDVQRVQPGIVGCLRGLIRPFSIDECGGDPSPVPPRMVATPERSALPTGGDRLAQRRP